MNVAENLENAHLLVIQSVDNLNELEWDIPIAEDSRTVKDIVAHLASYEHLLVDMFNVVLGTSSDTPYLTQYRTQHADFNKIQVEARSNHTAQQVVDEFEEAQADATSLLARIPIETIEKKGTLGDKERSLGDIVVALTGHIQRHCAEITAFRNREKQ